MQNTRNNFDLLRLFAAFQVAFSHSSVHLEHSVPFFWFLSLFPGVPIFFFLSGFLIYGSYQSSSNSRNQTLNFYSKRFLRLFPGLWVTRINDATTTNMSTRDLIDQMKGRDKLTLHVAART